MSIIFIVLTLGLGIGEYFTAKALQKKNADLASALSAYNSGVSDNATLLEWDGRLKETLGYSPDMKTEDISKDLEERLKGLGGVDYSSCADAIRGLVGEIGQRNADIQQANADRDQHFMTAAVEDERAVTQKADFDAEIDRITDTNKKEMVEAAKEYDSLSVQTVDQVREVEQAKRTAAVNREHLKKQTAAAEESVRTIAEINAVLRTRIEQLTDPYFEEPDGVVVYVDQDDRVVRLNIGKNQGLRLLTKFAIFDDSARQQGEIAPKGAVEVIRFVGDDQSDARIIDDEATLRSVIRSVDRDGAAERVLEAEMTDPIARGDLVYTPLWQRGERIGYALDYYLDVDGDGADDLDLLVNIINATGGEVDAWIDKNGELRGKITTDTTYLLESNTPTDEALDAADASEEVRAAVKEARAKLTEEARLDGLRPMKLNEFLRRSHFRQTSEVERFEGPGGLSAKPDTTRVPLIPNSAAPSVFNLNPDQVKIDPESTPSGSSPSADAEAPGDGDDAPVFRRREPKDP